MADVRTHPYQAVYDAIGLPPEAGKLASGEIPLPEHENRGYYQPCDHPDSQWGHPPAFIPLWVEGENDADDGPYFVGAWKHWFTDRRPMTYGIFAHQESAVVEEFARTWEQFLLRCLPSAEQYERDYAEYLSDLEDGEAEEPPSFLSEADDAFLRNFGLSREHPTIRELKTCLEEEHPRGFLAHPAFADRPPFDLCDGCGYPDRPYNGAFPHRNMPATAEALRQVAGLEVDYAVGMLALASGQAPPWLLTVDQASVFEAAMASGDWLGAWMSLNSPRWTYGEVREPLLRLARAAGDPAFTLLAETWCAQPHGAAQTYSHLDPGLVRYHYHEQYWDALRFLPSPDSAGPGPDWV